MVTWFYNRANKLYKEGLVMKNIGEEKFANAMQNYALELFVDEEAGVLADDDNMKIACC